MRRKERQLSQEAALTILAQGEYGVLSTVSAANQPYGVPLNYCWCEGRIYFHCALGGRKLDNIAHNPQVSFCVVGRTELLPDKFGTRYASCIVQGRIAELFATAKEAALQAIVHKYSAAFIAQGLEYIARHKANARVFQITPTLVSGKART